MIRNGREGEPPAEQGSLPASLAEVEALLQQTLERLERDWTAFAERRAEILGETDIPRLARIASTGGKRVRPVMVHWGWRAAGADEADRGELVRLAVAMELLHDFALVHDDVMDAAETRRGRPTIHAIARDAHRAAGGVDCARAFGDSVAILVGDLLHAEADHLVAGLAEPVLAAWRRMLIELVLGQSRDLTGAALGRRELGRAREVAVLKTGAYTVTRPLELGAILGGARAEVLAVLGRYGLHLGRAFGLRDDVIGVWGDPGLTGKPDAADLLAGKATAVTAVAERALSERGRAVLDALPGAPDAPRLAERVRREMTERGVRRTVEEMIGREAELALAALDPAVLPADALRGLQQLVPVLSWRES